MIFIFKMWRNIIFKAWHCFCYWILHGSLHSLLLEELSQNPSQAINGALVAKNIINSDYLNHFTNSSCFIASHTVLTYSHTWEFASLFPLPFDITSKPASVVASFLLSLLSGFYIVCLSYLRNSPGHTRPHVGCPQFKFFLVQPTWRWTRDSFFWSEYSFRLKIRKSGKFHAINKTWYLIPHMSRSLNSGQLHKFGTFGVSLMTHWASEGLRPLVIFTYPYVLVTI